MDDEFALDEETCTLADVRQIERRVDEAKRGQVHERQVMIEDYERLLETVEMYQQSLNRVLSKRPTLVDTGRQTDQISDVSAETRECWVVSVYPPFFCSILLASPDKKPSRSSSSCAGKRQSYAAMCIDSGSYPTSARFSIIFDHTQ